MNTVVCAKTNQDIILIDQIANSGEGEVWTTNWSGMLAKIYHDPTPDRFAKLKVMITHQPQDPNKHLNHNSFAFPQSLIKDNQGNLIGFLMPQIQGGVELIDIYNPKRRKIRKLEVDWHFLHYVALNITSIMAAIHREGYVIGDIKPQNILINNQALPSFIDTDSFQVKNPKTGKLHHCLVGTDGYTPPELIGKDFHNIEQYIYHDNFRLAILIYQLLFSYHPFSLGHWQGAGEKPEQNDLIKQGIWIESDHNLLTHNQHTIPLNILNSAIQILFKKCFNDGHKKPYLRPTAEDWFYALSQGINNLVICNQVESHIYSSLENSCYWCERKIRLHTDIFELPEGIKSTAKIRIKNIVNIKLNNINFKVERYIFLSYITTVIIITQSFQILTALTLSFLGIPLLPILIFISIKFNKNPTTEKKQNILKKLKKLQIKQTKIKNNISIYYQKYKDVKERYETKKKSLENEEKQEINRLNSPLEARLITIYTEINNLEQNKNQELTNKLIEIQEKFVNNQLSKAIITPRRIEGIGKVYTTKLDSYGITTAKDISYYTVIQIDGIGNYRASNLVSWRDKILDKAKQNMPMILPKSIEDEIILKYHNKFINLQNEKPKIDKDIRQNISLTKQKYKTKQDSLKIELNQDLQKINKSLNNINISEQENKLIGINMRISNLTQQFNSHKNWNFFVYILKILFFV